MSALSNAISEAFARDYQNRAAELHTWADPLTQEQFWRKPFSYGNSVGNLVLHLTGNLNYYIGAIIANTGYLRHRDVEFSDAGKPKQDVLRKFDDAIAMVVATILGQSESDWLLPYSAKGEEDGKNRFTIFLRCGVHLYHHIGQINYLSREVTK